jgi:hypothetical protein
MACFYCHRQGFQNIPDYGQCVVCKKAVCAPPPLRHDKKFHATESGCGGNELVCIYHQQQHAAEKGRTVADCFPTVAIQAGISVLAATSTEMSMERSASRLGQDTVNTFNDFLSFVTPGSHALMQAIARSGDQRLRDLVKIEREADPDILTVLFEPEFYGEGTMERVAVLAAYTIRDTAGSPLKQQTVAQRLKWLKQPVIAFLRGLNRDMPFNSVTSEKLLRAVVSADVPIASSLIRSLAYIQMPEASGIADWIVDATARADPPLILA